MYLPDTRRKLEDARIALDLMQAAENGAQFRFAFNTYLQHARAVTLTMQREAKGVAGFEAWYAPKKAIMQADSLLKFFNDERVSDFHRGESKLSYRLQGGKLISRPEDKPHPDAAMVFDADGAHWVVHEGTPNERRLPFRGEQEGTISVFLANPPSQHLGAEIADRSPVALATLGLRFIAELVHEAEQTLQ